MPNLSTKLNDFFRAQLTNSDIFAARYADLEQVQIRELYIDGMPIRVQYNPARAVSTTAKVDTKSIHARPCFLCPDNRLPGQLVASDFDGYDTLVNPFPIFNQHYTIASGVHQHQDNVDFEQMAYLSSSLPRMVVFYNGSHSGASAPDHLHFQAGELSFLPICEHLMKSPGQLIKHTPQSDIYSLHELTIGGLHIVASEVNEEIKMWLNTLLPMNATTGMPDLSMRNILMWHDFESQKLHILFFPRIAHRPSCYFAPEDEEKMLVSPGAVDMAGVLILPRKEDFEKITSSDIRKIYDEVSLDILSCDRLSTLLLQ